MRFTETHLPGLYIIEPKVFQDERGHFFEFFRADRFAEAGLPVTFVQGNQSRSEGRVLRGLHYQYPHSQGKLVRVLQGEIYDVALDLRRGSPTFGQWFGMVLSHEERKLLYIPEGFAHGFCVVSEVAEFEYQCTDFYVPECERGVRWDDSDLAIPWPVQDPILSEKDRGYPQLKDIDRDDLPSCRPLRPSASFRKFTSNRTPDRFGVRTQ